MVDIFWMNHSKSGLELDTMQWYSYVNMNQWNVSSSEGRETKGWGLFPEIHLWRLIRVKWATGKCVSRAEDDGRAEGIYRPRRMNQISFLRLGTPGFSYAATMKVLVQRSSAMPTISHSRLIWRPTVSSVVVPKNVLSANQRARHQFHSCSLLNPASF